MLDSIEKLLILQDRDRKIHRVQQELAQIAPERENMRHLTTSTQTQLDAAKTPRPPDRIRTQAART